MRIRLQIKGMGGTVEVFPYVTRAEEAVLQNIGENVNDVDIVRHRIKEEAASFVSANFSQNRGHNFPEWRRRDLEAQVGWAFTDFVDDIRDARGAPSLLPPEDAGEEA